MRFISSEVEGSLLVSKQSDLTCPSSSVHFVSTNSVLALLLNSAVLDTTLDDFLDPVGAAASFLEDKHGSAKFDSACAFLLDVS